VALHVVVLGFFQTSTGTRCIKWLAEAFTCLLLMALMIMQCFHCKAAELTLQLQYTTIAEHA
jgi:hypothetical protein